MRVLDFFKDRLLLILSSLFVSGFSAFLLYMASGNLYLAVFVPLLYMAVVLISLIAEFIIKNNFYRKLLFTLQNLDKKTLLPALLEPPGFSEGKILAEVLSATDKAMNDEIAQYSISSAQYREYIELWVHEIKTPIAGIKLICENAQNEEVMDELDKIDRLVEQALFYSRSGNVEKDFIIKQVSLNELAGRVLRKNAVSLIKRKISVEVMNLESTVFTDVKWTDFILQQLIDNAVKYKSSIIKITGVRNDNSVSLFVCDNGIGIPKGDLRRVFDKGFTGENGRLYAKSTGIGLYLCKKLCGKLGLEIAIQSQQGEGTTIEIVFPQSNLFLTNV